MRNITKITMGCIGTVLLLGSGCANHLRNIDTVSQETERKILGVKYELKLTPETLRDTTYHVDIEKLESAEVKKFEVHTVKELATPYQWWRELYEIPAGIGLLPVSIGSHLLFLCSFGMFPYDIPKSINELSFTGMNPMLNWESSTRTEETLVLMNKKMLSQGNENVKKPVAQKNILVKAGDLSKICKTDDFGGFTLNFLSLRSEEMFFPLSRKIVFSLESEKNKEIKHYILTRDFLAKLLRARSKMNTYAAHPSGKLLFETVIYLEKTGFEQLAYSLEESELQKHKDDRKFQTEFQTASQE